MDTKDDTVRATIRASFKRFAVPGATDETAEAMIREPRGAAGSRRAATAPPSTATGC